MRRAVAFVRERIWSELPSEVRARDRRLAAAAWGVVAPGLVLALIAWRHGAPSLVTVLWVMSAGVLLGGVLLTERWGTPTYLAVLRSFSIVGFIVGTAVLTLSFFLLVTPMGLVLRRTGKLGFRAGFRGRHAPQWIVRAPHHPVARYGRMA